MATDAGTTKTSQFLDKEKLDLLLKLLVDKGYTTLGPTVKDDVITLGPIHQVDDFPRGVSDQQSGGRYELVDGEPELLFDFVVGPDSAKRFLFPMVQKLMRMHVEKKQFVLDETQPQPPQYAFIGLRPCDMAAVLTQDRVFGYNDTQTFRCESEPHYNTARAQACFIVVNCTVPGGNCFCQSMDTGPSAREGFDLALTEIRSGFLVEIGTLLGQEIADGLPLREASSAEQELVEIKMEQSAKQMGKQLDTDGLGELLNKAISFTHWDDVAKRCLSCGNCTMVCPTCFCSTVTDSTDLTGKDITRVRRWESCLSHQFSYTIPSPHRNTIRSRYRQWLRHKLCTWHEQFDSSGCVGCGRCITWCPVGIDLTDEVAAIRGAQSTVAAKV